MKLEFVIPGKPVPKQRPRFGGGKVWTPKKTKDFENLVGYCANLAIIDQKLVCPVKAPVKLTIELYSVGTLPYRCRVIRSSTGKSEAFEVGDLDNLAKSMMDGMNKVVYDDDRQVVDLSIRRCKRIITQLAPLPYTYITVQTVDSYGDVIDPKTEESLWEIYEEETTINPQ